MRCWIEFYADKRGQYSNKHFKFRVNDLKNAKGAVTRFISYGNEIRAAWFIDEYLNLRMRIK